VKRRQSDQRKVMSKAKPKQKTANEIKKCVSVMMARVRLKNVMRFLS